MKHTKPNIQNGMGLIIVILVLAFLLAVGITVIAVTQTGPEVAGNVRLQAQALQAAEAGFDAAWKSLNDQFNGGLISDFSNLYRTTYGGSSGLDDPLNANYFRSLTDREIAEDVLTNSDNELFRDTDMPGHEIDHDFAYTVFLINDESVGTPDDTDCIMVCIGRGPRMVFARLEVEIALN